MRIILASKSPRRKELLSKIIEEFEIQDSNFNEDSIIEKNPDKLVKKLALGKAKETFYKEKDKEDLIVIGGDTIVYYQSQVLGKPKDISDAFKTLKMLQGNSNEVYSGFAIIAKIGNKIIEKTYCTKSIVYMKDMTDEEINYYINTKEPLDKAGSYAVQGIGGKYIEKIDGNYDAVVGLDIELIQKTLSKLL